jgi:hypothetical protein
MSEIIEQYGLKFESDRISTIRKGLPSLTINREEIKNISFKKGLLSRYPLLQLIMGSCITLFGIFMIVLFCSWWFTKGGYPHPRQILLFFTLPIGVWIIFDTLKKGYYLEVQYNSKVRKLEFDKTQSEENLLKLIDAVKNKLNYNINII